MYLKTCSYYMKKTFVFFLIIGLSSCKSKIDFCKNEIIILEQKLERIYSDFQIRVLLRPDMYQDKYQQAIKLRDSIDLFIDRVTNNSSNNAIIDIYYCNYYFNNLLTNEDEFQKELISQRLSKWKNNEINSYAANCFKLDLMNIEYELVEYLFNTVEKEYYKFNKLDILVIDSSWIKKVGGTYTAHVYVAAIDTYSCLNIVLGEYYYDNYNLEIKENMDNCELLIKDGFGIVRKKLIKAGEDSITGIIRIYKPDGTICKYPFKRKFEIKE